MGWFDELSKGVRLRGLAPSGPVTVIDVDRLGSDVVNLTYEDGDGRVHRELLYRDNDVELLAGAEDRQWTFDADPELFVLVAEAKRISLAYLFDPYLATHSSDVELLPHQIEAVYLDMLTENPLRFLLADDPGAGKTIMAGLLIKELIVRGDLERCLIVVPGGLAEQWQDELGEKVGLEFELLTREMVESTRSGNPFETRHRLIARLDMLARDEGLQVHMGRTDWDLVVVDEAHKMSATYRGGDVEATKRYRLGQRLERAARHFLLMTATPHNGKPEDFQLFMALLDEDRFAGRFRRGAHSDEPPSDLMRRRVKEELLRFDGTKLFPEREATTAKYPLSDDERDLYEKVTEYVTEGMNRARRLRQEGEGRRSAVVGFALTVLQRRLASSPRAIWRSLQRRRERLSARLAEAEMYKAAAASRPASPGVEVLGRVPSGYALADFEDLDPDELLSSETETVETEILDEATAARTAEELRVEIAQLERLEQKARQVHSRGEDRKWEELARLLQSTPEMIGDDGRLRKLIVFTEHRDTLEYLVERLVRLLGRDGAVVSIHGGIRREDRRQIQHRFTQDEQVRILVATDAAGEGLNLQRAHLMVNYDLPWNPNRIEQRFGRIHRIGQTEVCRLWNLVADETREGKVFERLLDKLEEQRKALGGKVFDVLGQAFSDRSLRDLLIEAITSDTPELQQLRMNEIIDATVTERVRELIEEHSLLAEELAPDAVAEIRDRMARARPWRLLPSFVRRFFLAAFELLDGRVTRHEGDRYQVRRVPPALRRWDSDHGQNRLLERYERVCFEQERIAVTGKPRADLLSPGHPLLDAAVGAVLDSHASALAQGAILIDSADDASERPRVLIFLEHEVVDAGMAPGRPRRPVSTRFEYVEITEDGDVSDAGAHPYLDCRVPDADELDLLRPLASAEWVRDGLERTALHHAVRYNIPRHLGEVQDRVHRKVDRTLAAVEQRLTAERNHWDNEVLKLKSDEMAGKRNARLNSAQARRRADEADERLRRRKQELALQRKLAALPPRVVGAAFVVSEALLARLAGHPSPQTHPADTARIERLAVDAVLAAERAIGREPHEMPHNHKGYDIETRAADGLLFMEVKGRVTGAEDFVVTSSEVIAGLNNEDRHILALVEVADDDTTTVRYLYEPFTGRQSEPGYGEQKRVLSWPDHWNLAASPQ